MSGIWAHDLDMLAQAGVLNFDAPSYIMGQPARYVGNPTMQNPFSQDYQPKLKDQPQIDELQKQGTDKNVVDTPIWKKVLFGTLAVAGLIFVGYKCKGGFKKAWDSVVNFFKGGSSSATTGKKGFWKNVGDKIQKGWDATKKWTSKAWDSTKQFCSKCWDSTKNFFVKGWNKLFKKSTP